MHDFEYEAPATLDRAIELMQEHAGSVKPLAGGTDLIDQMRMGRLAPRIVLDVKRIEDLNILQVDSGGLRLGAAVPCYRIHEHPEIVRSYSALADSCRIIGGVQIQSRASVGGNLCNSGPAADTTPSLIALQATCVIAGPRGLREVPVADFCTAPGENVLDEGELLVELRLPPPQPHAGSHYRRMIPRNEMDIAVTGVGAAVMLDAGGSHFVAARVGLGAVAPTPLLADAVSEVVAGQPVADATYERAADAARDLIAPITDMRGTADYRRHVTGVLTRRVLAAAVSRARGEADDYRVGH